MKQVINLIDLEKKVFDITREPMPRGAWWWWFWMFFFNNPKNPKKPRQLMILWSTKNVKEISCNDLKIRLKRAQDRNNLDGAVAAWYFDGEKMHHNFLLEQCRLKVSEKGISSDSKTPTSFSVDKTRNTIRIGEDFYFVADANNKHRFTMPTYDPHTYIGNMGYSMLKLNHLDLKGRVYGAPIHGSAYFQRVFVNAPGVPWYWGVFHFENGGTLTYFNPHVLGKSVKKDISLFDGNKMHQFKDIRVEREGEKLPSFLVSGENEEESVRFTVNAYSHSSWTFKRRFLRFIPTKLVYNEYPATITDLELTNKATGEKITARGLGKAVGNAEDTRGFLL